MNIRDAYNEWSAIYDSNLNRTRDLDAELLRAALSGRRFESVIEIGCGTGKNTVFLAEIADALLALDFSEQMLAQARSKMSASSATHVRFAQADITTTWPSGDASANLVTCNLVLEHIEDLDAVFAEAARVLRPGGWFVVHELHPFKQYGGTKARFERGAEIVEVDVFVHHVSDFLRAAARSGLQLVQLDERWHADDAGKPPRLLALVFAK
jgi:ubiquinone/menaquinone biosynthesis C-methylase UbiE